MTSDEYPAYASAIEAPFGVPAAGRPAGPGRRPILSERRLPEGLVYATVHKEREKDRVVAVERRLVFGTEAGLEAALGGSSARAGRSTRRWWSASTAPTGDRTRGRRGRRTGSVRIGGRMRR